MSDHSDKTQTLNSYIAQARKQIEQQRFDEALSTLREAYKLPSITTEDESQIQAVEKQIAEKRGQRIQTLTSALENLLRKEPEELAQTDLDSGQEILASLNSIHPTPTDLEETLVHRWQIRRDKVTARLDLEKTRQQLDALWQSSYLVLSQYDQALSLARQKAQAYDGKSLAEEFQNLLAAAQLRREEAYKKEGEITTQAAYGDFNALIKELDRLRLEGAEELPWYEWKTEKTEDQPERKLLPVENVPANDAIQRIRELAAEYENKKAEEYLHRAQMDLPADPESAEKWVQDASRFKHISDHTKSKLDSYYDETVKPALEKRHQAKELVQGARNASTENIEKAWKLLQQAQQVDTNAPEITEARKLLRPSFRIFLKDRLRQAHEKRQTGDFETAENMASTVIEDAKDDEYLIDVIDQATLITEECGADKSLFEGLQRSVTEIKDLTDSDLAAAAQLLAELETQIAGRPQKFQQLLSAARHAVQTRQSLEKLLADWERRFQAINPGRFDNIETLRQAADELDRLDQEIGQLRADRGRQKDLLDFQKRIESRQNFVTGRLDWEEGLYQRAITEWKKVVRAKCDDASLAEEWLQKAQDASAVSHAIEQAQAYLADKKYQQAIETLRNWHPDKLAAGRADAPESLTDIDWRTRASPKQTEVRTLYSQIERQWAADLEEDIKELIGSLEQRPAYTELEQKIRQLEAIDSQKARNYKYDHLLTIYEEWGDLEWKAGIYHQAEKYYGEALELATGENRSRLENKRYQARREQVFFQAEHLINQDKQDKRQEAQAQLSSWLNEAPNDVPTLAWLADLAMADEKSERARTYLQQAERRLNTAEQENNQQESNPSRAGLQSIEEIVQWRLKLEGLHRKAAAVDSIGRAKERIHERLRQSAALREYRLAEETRGGLIDNLRQSRQEMLEQQKEHPYFSSLSKNSQDIVERSWREVRRWFDEQERAIPDWYALQERILLGELRNLWRQTEAPGMENLDFRAASSEAGVRQRWETGLKIRFLFRDDQDGEVVLREITHAQGRLQRVVEEFVSDEEGPEYNLRQEKLDPPDTLQMQLDWSEHLLDWAELVTGLLESYNWASERREATREQEPRHYQEARGIRSQIERFRTALSALRSALLQAEGRLKQAKTAGRDGRHRWEHVPWAKIVKNILYSPTVPLPREGEKELNRDYWQNLEHNEVVRRWDAWQQAVNILRQVGYPAPPQAVPWEEINHPIRQTGIQEDWVEVGAPLQEHLVQFGRHRTVLWILEEREQAEKKRNTLVLAVLMLYALVQAEEFPASLEQLGQIENSLDKDNEYGFRSGKLISKPKPLSWPELRTFLEDQQTQSELFQTWWAKVENSALSRWQETRNEIVSLMFRAEPGPSLAHLSHSPREVTNDADERGELEPSTETPEQPLPFGAAEMLCQDALWGAQAEGRTNRLGGGLALEPLRHYLDPKNRPSELKEAISFRLQQALKTAAGKYHDVQEAVADLRFWLIGENGNHLPVDVTEPIAMRRAKFLAQKEALEDAIRSLREERWWPWQKRAKEDQRRYCRELLESIRHIAPEWPELEQYDRLIEER